MADPRSGSLWPPALPVRAGPSQWASSPVLASRGLGRAGWRLLPFVLFRPEQRRNVRPEGNFNAEAIGTFPRQYSQLP